LLVAIAAAAPSPLAEAAASPQGKLGGCKKVALLFARGTTEAGTMGITVGPALQRALEAKFPGQVRAEGIRYPADFGGAFSGGMNSAAAKGAIEMGRVAKSIMQSCPETKIVLAGYSQGAEQVHGALAKPNLGDLGAKIAAAITYGDPMATIAAKMNVGIWGCLPEDRTKVFCNKGDGVCGGAFSISAAHMSYTTNGDVGKGATFASQMISGGKFNGLSGEACRYPLDLSKGAPPKPGGPPAAAPKSSGPPAAAPKSSGPPPAAPKSAEPPATAPESSGPPAEDAAGPSEPAK